MDQTCKLADGVGEDSVSTCSDRANCEGFIALAAGADVEFDMLTLFEGLEARTLDVGEMDEDVIAVFSGDEPESLLVVEELYGACCHARTHFFQMRNPLRTPAPIIVERNRADQACGIAKYATAM